MTKFNKMFLVLGDWSGDGHNISEKVLVEVNQTVPDVQRAYKASCKLTGVSFNHNEDFTGTSRSYTIADNYRIATGYGSGLDITDEVAKAFKKHGIEFEVNEDAGLEEQFVKLWFDFVKLSLPDLEWRIPKGKDEIPCINGYWGDLNVQFGYGLYGD
jgi:hypothetical protein